MKRVLMPFLSVLFAFTSNPSLSQEDGVSEPVELKLWNTQEDIDHLITQGKNLYLTLNEFSGIEGFHDTEEYLQYSLDLNEFKSKWKDAMDSLPKHDLYIGYIAKANEAFSYFDELDKEIEHNVQTPKFLWIKKKFEEL